MHIPFPSAELFRQLPVREEILSSMVQCDLIGFHEHSYLRHFDVTLKAILGVDSSLFQAEVDGHIVKLGVYPISIDTEAFKKKAETAEVVAKTKEYREQSVAPFLLLGIDRLDYTKGIELKLLGLQHAFKKYPELVGKISLLQVAVPTRERVSAYRNLKKIIDRLVGAINGEFGGPNYSPVQYIFRSIPETELLAMYRRADSILVTSKRDGMNLVAMEYTMAQDLETPGTLILSEFAGAASLLSDALIINPWDADAIADAIYRCYKMPFEERQERLSHMQNILLRYSATKWAAGFLEDLEAIDKTVVKRKVEPLSPDKAKWSAHFKQHITPRKLRLVLDYDGTVVALAKTPARALLLEETKKLLLEMHERFEIFVLSGRPKEFLDVQFGNMPIFLAAEHGAFFKNPGSEWETRISSDIESWYPNIKKAMEAYTEKVPLSYLETKKACLVWHYRQSPEDFGEFQARKLYDELRVGMSNAPISVMMGAKIVEAKATECNKGSFLRWLIQNSNDTGYSYICLGDDKTDEDMFKVLGDAGASIKIGRDKTEAQFRLASQDEVIPFFRSLIKFVDEEAP
ncbi:Trehalose-phosphate synthase [compost metagenome]